MRGKHGAPRILCSARHTAKYDETCLPRGVGKLVRQAKERRRNSFARRKKKKRRGGGDASRAKRRGKERRGRDRSEGKGCAARGSKRSESGCHEQVCGRSGIGADLTFASRRFARREERGSPQVDGPEVWCTRVRL